MAIFYEQTEDPILAVEVIPIGEITYDLTIIHQLESPIEVLIDRAFGINA